MEEEQTLFFSVLQVLSDDQVSSFSGLWVGRLGFLLMLVMVLVSFWTAESMDFWEGLSLERACMAMSEDVSAPLALTAV